MSIAKKRFVVEKRYYHQSQAMMKVGSIVAMHSRGLMESWSHFVSSCVPTFMGGASAEELPADGGSSRTCWKTAKESTSNGSNLCWRSTFPSGCYLFWRGLLFSFSSYHYLWLMIKSKSGLLAIVVLSLLHCLGGVTSALFTYFLFEYFPLYNKFRTPSMALAPWAGISIPTLGILALSKVLFQRFG